MAAETSRPTKGDFLLVRFLTDKSKRKFVAEVMTLDKIKNEIEVTYLRKTRCSNKVFTYPVEDKELDPALAGNLQTKWSGGPPWCSICRYNTNYGS